METENTGHSRSGSPGIEEYFKQCQGTGMVEPDMPNIQTTQRAGLGEDQGSFPEKQEYIMSRSHVAEQNPSLCASPKEPAVLRHTRNRRSPCPAVQPDRDGKSPQAGTLWIPAPERSLLRKSWKTCCPGTSNGRHRSEQAAKDAVDMAFSCSAGQPSHVTCIFHPQQASR